MEGWKEHIRSMEDEKFVRLDQFIKSKEFILNFVRRVGVEAKFKIEVPCEETDRYVLSSSNLAWLQVFKRCWREKLRRIRKWCSRSLD